MFEEGGEKGKGVRVTNLALVKKREVAHQCVVVCVFFFLWGEGPVKLIVTAFADLFIPLFCVYVCIIVSISLDAYCFP